MKEKYMVKLTQDEVDALALICSVIGGYPDTTSRSVFSPDSENPDVIDLEKVSTFYNMILNRQYSDLMKYRSGGVHFNKKVL
jgi:hypothetical protein